jgi:hypothetical protein
MATPKPYAIIPRASVRYPTKAVTRRVRRGDNCPGRYGSEPTINDDGANPFLPDMRWSGVTFLRIVR